MSKMNDLATLLDDLAGTAVQLKMCVQDLLTAANRMRDCLPPSGEDEPEPKAEKPAPEPEAPKPRPRRPRTQPEPEPEPETPAAPQYTKEQIRAMLADLADRGHRDEAKALVAKYASGGSFSDIDPAKYPELADEVKQYG